MTMGDCDGVMVCVLVVWWNAGLVGGGFECWSVDWPAVGLCVWLWRANGLVCWCVGGLVDWFVGW